MAQNGPTLASAYVKIVPTTKGFKSALEGDEEFTGAGDSAGKGFAKKLIGTATKIFAVAKIGQAIGDSIKQGAALQQSLGGVETLFKQNADKVKAYAKEAYRTSGVSANDYMENVTSFSASLISSLKGNTVKAADVANMAMIDMSDNANKMGTDMAAIQTAYQGFAKQNYAMLDNLKLGYGGTKTEMQRLLADAQKITGVKYDINNLSDVYSAIHAIQGKLDITGTTQKEAMTTLSGSFNMLKASWQDFLGNMALGQKLDFKPLLTSINAVIFGSGGIIYMAGNISKALMDALKNLPNALNSIGPKIANLFSSGNLSALQINIATVINEIISSFVNIGGKITNAFAANFPSMLSNILTFLQQMGNYLSAQAPYLISKGFEMLNNLVNGIINAIPVLIQKLPQIITTFANIINDNAPTIVTKGFELVGKLVMGIIKAIPLVIQNIPQILKAIWSVFTAFQWLNLGKTVMSALGNGIKAMKGSIGNAAKNIGETIINFIKSIPGRLISLGRSMINGLKNAISGGAGGVRSVMSRIGQVIVNSLKAIPGQLSNIGVNLVKGLWNGIGNMTGWIKSKISGFGKSVVNGLKSFFHIHSPSTLMRDEIGIYLGQGIGIGIEDSAGFVNKKASLLGAGIIENVQSQLNGGLKLDDVYSKVTASYQMSNHDTASQSRLDRIIRLLELLLGKNTDIYIDKEKVIKMIDKELGELAYE